MSQDTNVENLIINVLTKAQYESITPSATQIYLITDDVGIASSDIINALGYTPYNSTNPNNYTSNVGTVTSVNGEQPDSNGDVSIAIPTVNNGILTILKNGIPIGTFTANQSGNSTVNIEADTVLADNLTITKNADDELQAIGVIDKNSGGTLKYWTGTKAQYDAIITKDPTTLYNVTDTEPSYSVNTQYKNIGAIVQSMVPLTDAGLHLMDGTLINGGGIYAEFVDYIAELYADNPTANCFCTETEWQNSVTTYGSCGKFVYNSTNNTVRLPKVSDILQGTTDLTALGDLIEAGLPNITGSGSLGNPYGLLNGDSLTSGAISKGTQRANGNQGAAGATSYDLAFDASRSSSLYKNNFNKVQPQTIKILLYIVIATSSKTDIQVDIDNIATDLNGKADNDLSNINNTAKVSIAHYAMPSNKYINLTLGASGTTYTAPSDGYIQLVKRATGVNQFIAISPAGLYTGVGNSDCLTYSQSVADQILAVYAPVRKGEQFYIYYSAAGPVYAFKFIYAVGSESEVQ